ncbi:MAG: hypothetical protein R3F59_08210 [Myxococcota bacterium]
MDVGLGRDEARIGQVGRQVVGHHLRRREQLAQAQLQRGIVLVGLEQAPVDAQRPVGAAEVDVGLGPLDRVERIGAAGAPRRWRRREALHHRGDHDVVRVGGEEALGGAARLVEPAAALEGEDLDARELGLGDRVDLERRDRLERHAVRVALQGGAREERVAHRGAAVVGPRQAGREHVDRLLPQQAPHELFAHLDEHLGRRVLFEHLAQEIELGVGQRHRGVTAARR